MNKEIVEVAATLVAYLAPFMPYLQEAGKRFAGEMGKATWENAQDIWKRIMARFENDREIMVSASALAYSPENEVIQSMLAKALATRLQETPAFAEELLSLLGGPQTVQEIRVSKGSWIENVIQDTSGGDVQQTVEARDWSVVKVIKQIKR